NTDADVVAHGDADHIEPVAVDGHGHQPRGGSFDAARAVVLGLEVDALPVGRPRGAFPSDAAVALARAALAVRVDAFARDDPAAAHGHHVHGGGAGGRHHA